MEKNSSWIEPSAFLNHLQTTYIKKILVFDEISSTNLKAQELARQGETEGTLVLARQQTRGRGRFNRIWESPPGGLYLSLILRPSMPPEKTTLLPLIAALAVAETITSYQLQVAIKWPNDVRINKKKTAGILLESETNGSRIDFLILGVGINLNTKNRHFPQELRKNITSLAQELGTTIEPERFLKELIIRLDQQITRFYQGKTKEILADWKHRSDTLGKQVKILTSQGEITGKAVDVDPSGFLIVASDKGERNVITAGDCLYLDELERIQ